MNEKVFQSAKFLLVDDEMSNIRLLERNLEEWGCYNVECTTDPREVLSLYQEFQPDIILLDLMMPHLDGFAVLEQLRSDIRECPYLPVVVLTSNITLQAKRNALAGGAKDFLTKPLDATELFLRLWNQLEIRWLHQQLYNQNQFLEQQVQRRTHDLEISKQQLEDSQIEILERLARAGEYRDDDTGLHTQRVSNISGLLAEKLGLALKQIAALSRAATLHDVGKIGIPDNVLLKPGKLTLQEFDLIKTHTTVGAALLTGGHSDLVCMAEHVALSHHERWDGGGYPHGVAGENIPLEGRILAVADVFDALTHDRPYKSAWPVEAAVAEIQSGSGTQFDPRIVEAFDTLPHASLI